MHLGFFVLLVGVLSLCSELSLADGEYSPVVLLGPDFGTEVQAQGPKAGYTFASGHVDYHQRWGEKTIEAKLLELPIGAEKNDKYPIKPLLKRQGTFTKPVGNPII